MAVTSRGTATPGGASGGYTGGSGNWGASAHTSSDPGGKGSGSCSSSIGSQKNPPKSTSTECTFKQQIFIIKCTGMKPNTIHKFYYENVDRGVDCIPVNPKPTGSAIRPGADLKTDAMGNIEFNFYFTLDVEKQVDATNKVKYEVAGDKKFELRATDSTASKIVPMKTHNVSSATSSSR